MSDFSMALVPKTADFTAALIPRNLEAEQAAKPTIAPQPNPMPLVAPSGEALAGGGGPSPEALAGRREAFKIGTKAYGTTVGATMGAELLPEAYGTGVLGKLLLKPIATGAGAMVGNVAGGGTPTEAAETGATVAGSTALFGGLGLAGKSLLRSGLLGQNVANYFSEATNGNLIPTDKLNDIKMVHEAFGIKPGDLSLKPGVTGIEGAYKIPAESLLERSGLSARQLASKTPDQLGQIVEPLWKKAGENIDAIADAATKKGIRIDAGKIVRETIADMLDPQGEQALAKANDIGNQLGIDWKKATPRQLLDYRRAVYDLPPRFSDRLYGPLTRALKEAVPEIAPEDKAFSELSELRNAAVAKRAAGMVRVSPTKFEQMLDLLQRHPKIAGPIKIGSSVATGLQAYQGGRALYDWMTEK